MIHVDVEGFLIHVPLKQHMSAAEFLAIADKLAQVTGHHVEHYAPPAQPYVPPQPVYQEPAYAPPAQPAWQVPPPVPAQPAWEPEPVQPMRMRAPEPMPVAAPSPFPPPQQAASAQDLRFDKEEELRMQHMLNQIRSQMGQLKGTEDRLDSHETHLKQILSYLHSLDKHLRK